LLNVAIKLYALSGFNFVFNHRNWKSSSVLLKLKSAHWLHYILAW